VIIKVFFGERSGMTQIKRAILSVSDKTRIAWFARELDRMGVELISTGGTYKLLKKEGIKATPVAEVTGFPECLDGRVKTLHPKIHGGILADRSKPEHLRQLEFQKIKPIDLVVVNLYPFAETVAKNGVTFEEAIEQIDIGGPTMVRAAAKNHAHVAVVVNPSRYEGIIEEMKDSGGRLSYQTRMELAREAFEHTAKYDAMISAYLSRATSSEKEKPREDHFPQEIKLSLRKVSELRYGENPHQAGALYAYDDPPMGSLVSARKVSGSALSFNNILDAEAAWSAVIEFDEPACAIIKHNNPCGAAIASDLKEAYLKAYECDPTSAFGSVVAFNGTINEACARALLDNFIEVLIAQEFDDDVIEILSEKKDMRIIEMGNKESTIRKGFDLRHIYGGMLVQDYDTDPYQESKWKLVTKVAPTHDQIEDLLFAWKVCKHVKSNAIVLARNGATVGIGAGQMSRVDSAMIACEKASERARGCVVASDAFFPFPDAVDRVISAGALSIVQPGGSVRDAEVIDLCDRKGVSMLFTGIRHFRH